MSSQRDSRSRSLQRMVRRCGHFVMALVKCVWPFGAVVNLPKSEPPRKVARRGYGNAHQFPGGSLLLVDRLGAADEAWSNYVLGELDASPLDQSSPTIFDSHHQSFRNVQ